MPLRAGLLLLFVGNGRRHEPVRRAIGAPGHLGSASPVCSVRGRENRRPQRGIAADRISARDCDPPGAAAEATGDPPPRDLYLVNADGTGLRQLTRTPDIDERVPAPPPDGRKFTYNYGDYRRRADAHFATAVG